MENFYGPKALHHKLSNLFFLSSVLDPVFQPSWCLPPRQVCSTLANVDISQAVLHSLRASDQSLALLHSPEETQPLPPDQTASNKEYL